MTRRRTPEQELLDQNVVPRTDLSTASGTVSVGAVTKKKDDAPEPAVMRRHNERSRVVVDGRRTDDGQLCTLVVVPEVAGDCVAFYPHGVAQLGVRLTRANAVAVAQTILAGAQ